MSSTLIKNAAVILTGLNGPQARTAGPDLRIADRRITAIGKLSANPGENIVDASDCVIYPAWINTHHHLFQSLLKGDPLGINATLTPWLATTPYRYRAAFDAELFRLAARVGMIELVLSGCGTIADHNYVYYPGQNFDASAILFEEAEALGLRFILCRGSATRTRQLEAELPQAMRPEPLERVLKDVEDLAKRFHDPAPDSMRRVVMAPTTPPYSMLPEELSQAAAFARSLGLRLHSHLSETVGYQDSVNSQHGLSPVKFCQEHGWLGPDVWFAHLVKLDQDEIDLLGRTGTGIAHCPQSNGRLGSGIAPIRALEAAGVPVSIGVDGAASNEAADMISETHAAWLMQRARGGHLAIPQFRGGSGEAGASDASVEDVVRWGTSGGARVLGLDKTGSLEVGMEADIAIYALDQSPRYFGIHDPALAPVICGGAAHLKRLFIAGQEVVREGALPDHDMDELGAQARNAVKILMQRTEAVV